VTQDYIAFSWIIFFSIVFLAVFTSGFLIMFFIYFRKWRADQGYYRFFAPPIPGYVEPDEESNNQQFEVRGYGPYKWDREKRCGIFSFRMTAMSEEGEEEEVGDFHQAVGHIKPEDFYSRFQMYLRKCNVISRPFWEYSMGLALWPIPWHVPMDIRTRPEPDWMTRLKRGAATVLAAVAGFYVPWLVLGLFFVQAFALVVSLPGALCGGIPHVVWRYREWRYPSVRKHSFARWQIIDLYDPHQRVQATRVFFRKIKWNQGQEELGEEESELVSIIEWNAFKKRHKRDIWISRDGLEFRDPETKEIYTKEVDLRSVLSARNKVIGLWHLVQRLSRAEAMSAMWQHQMEDGIKDFGEQTAEMIERYGDLMKYISDIARKAFVQTYELWSRWAEVQSPAQFEDEFGHLLRSSSHGIKVPLKPLVKLLEKSGIDSSEVEAMGVLDAKLGQKVVLIAG
jgi:hypothetical protein